MSPYVFLDDGFHSNPKVIEAGLDGAGLYARALSYCGHYLTDGYLGPNTMVALSDKRPKLVALCVELGLFRLDGERYWIRDYLDHNPSRAQVEARREQQRTAGRKGAVAKARAEARAKATAKASAKAPAKADPQATVSREAPSPSPSLKEKEPSPSLTAEPECAEPENGELTNEQRHATFLALHEKASKIGRQM